MLIPGSQGTQAIDSTGVSDAQSIHSMIHDHMERRINVGYHLWGLLTLFLWMKRWKVEVPPAMGSRESLAAGVLAAR